MKILLVVNSYFAEEDGTSIRLKKMLPILLKNNHLYLQRADSDIITISTENPSNFGKTHLKPYIGRNIFIRIGIMIKWYYAISASIIINKPDLIYLSNDWHGFIPIHVLSKFIKFKILFDAHAILSQEMIELETSHWLIQIYKKLEKYVISNSDHVITCSPNISSFYSRYNDNIITITVFVDETKYYKQNSYHDTNFKRVGLIGPFDLIFNRHYLDFVQSNIDDFDPRIKFVIIGSCSQRILHDRIEYTGFLADTDTYINAICSLDALVVPSKIATGGPLNKIIESMSCSVPVFTTPKGIVGLCWIKPNQDIFVFNDNQLVDQINKIIFDDAMLTMVAQNARAIVEKFYSITVNKTKLQKILDGLR